MFQSRGHATDAWRAMLLAIALAGLATPGCSTARPPGAPVQPSAEQQARAVLEQAYTAQRDAFLAKDVEAAMALRAPDFEAITPDGVTHGAEEMAAGLRNLLGNVEWVALSNRLGEIRMTGEGLAVDVEQHSIRRQMRDGRLRQIENWVTQRETWIRTPEGLKLRRVDNLRDQCVLFDGQLRDPGQAAGCALRGAASPR